MDEAMEANEEQVTPQAKNRTGRSVGGIVVVLLLLVAAGFFLIGNVQGREAEALDQSAAAADAGDWESARDFADAALAEPAFLQRQTARAYGLRGIARYYLGEDGALADLDEAIALNENVLDLYAYRALLGFAAGELDAAEADAGKALADETALPDYLRTWLQVELALRGEGETAVNAAAAAIEQPLYLTTDQVAQLAALVALAEPIVKVAEARLALAQEESGLSTVEKAGLQAIVARAAFADGLYAAAFDAAAAALDAPDALDDETAAEMHLIQVERAYQEGDFVAGLAAAEAAEELGAESAWPAVLRGLEAYAALDWRTAIAEADDALTLDPENALALFVKGGSLLWQGDMAAANDLLDSAVAADESHVAARVLRGYTRLELDDQDGAAADIAAAAEMAPGDPVVLWGQAAHAIEHDDYDRAAALLNAAIAQDATRPEYYVWRSLSRQRDSDLHLAQVDVEIAELMDPNGLFVQLSRVRFARRTEVNERLTELLAEIISIYPDYTPLYGLLAGDLAILGQIPEAYDVLDAGIERWEESRYLQISLGRVQYISRDLPAARETLLALLEKDPENNSVLFLLTQVETTADNVDAALDYIEQAIENAPNALDFQVAKANALVDGDMLEMAWPLVNQVLEVDGRNLHALQLRGHIYSLQGEWEAAERDIERAIGLYPQNAESYAMLAQFQFRQSNLEEARSAGHKALTRNPAIYSVHATLWNVANNLGDDEEAAEHNVQFREKMLGTADDYLELAFYDLHTGDFVQLRADAEAGLELEPEDDVFLYLVGVAQLNLGAETAGRETLQQVMERTEDVTLMALAEEQFYRQDNPVGMVAEGNRDLYVDELWGYVVEIPEGWELESSTEPVVLSAFREEGEDFIGMGLLVIIDPITSSGLDIIGSVMTGEYENQGYTVEEPISLTISHQPALALEFAYTLGNVEVVGIGYFIIHNDVLYWINFEMLGETVGVFDDDMALILETFAFQQ